MFHSSGTRAPPRVRRPSTGDPGVVVLMPEQAELTFHPHGPTITITYRRSVATVDAYDFYDLMASSSHPKAADCRAWLLAMFAQAGLPSPDSR